MPKNAKKCPKWSKPHAWQPFFAILALKKGVCRGVKKTSKNVKKCQKKSTRRVCTPPKKGVKNGEFQGKSSFFGTPLLGTWLFFDPSGKFSAHFQYAVLIFGRLGGGAYPS